MFHPKTPRIQWLVGRFPETLIQLEKVFDKSTHVYIDFANVKHWQKKLGWQIDLRRLKQLFDSFDTVKSVKFYYGTLENDLQANAYTTLAKKCLYNVKTKPVKMMDISIDVSGIHAQSPFVLANFISRPFLKKLDIETVEFLNGKLRELNKRGIKYIEVMKCNFDVEIGRDMFLDYEKNKAENFILWSGDSDFADPVEQLMKDGKKVLIFAIARRVAVELANTQVGIFDIRKIKEFICKSSELPEEILSEFKKIGL